MRHFPDTSFLCSIYREQRYSPQADALMDSSAAPLPVSGLLALEFRQSIRFQARLYGNDRTRGFSRQEGTRMLRDFQSDLSSEVLGMVAVDWADVYHIAERLSVQHTEDRGHRLTDILHVATAVHLGTENFLTFDANQRTLAEAEGMTVPFVF